MIQQNYYPCTQCRAVGHFKQKSDPYFYKNKYDKLYINYKKGDDLQNGPYFITLIPWNYNEDNPRKYLRYRIHISSGFLTSMQQAFAIDS